MTVAQLAVVPRHTRAADERDEVEAHRQEALAFVDEAWPLVSVFELIAREIGPQAYQAALRLGRLLSSYEARHLPLDPEPAEAAA